MSKLKKMFIMLIFFVFTVANLYTMSYAASVKVTEENLKSAIQKFVSSSDNDNNYQITVENNQIKITSGEENYTLNYDLTSKPTFTYEVDITQGMSYQDYQEKTNSLSIAMIGYIAVADIQGIDYEDSLVYFAMCLLGSSFSGLVKINLNDSYIIVDDTQEGVTYEKDPNNTKIIYASEFGNHVMEYTNAMYSEKQSLKDTDDFNTFEISTEMKDKTSTSCKLVTTLTVNTDADFSQMKGYAEKMTSGFNGSNNNNNNDNNKVATTSQNNNFPIDSSSKSSESIKDTTSSKTILPKAGTTDTIILISVIFISIIIATIFVIQNRKYKDIK